MRWLVVFLVVWPAAGGPATQAPTSAPIALEGRPLLDVLADYEAAGYRFIYSTELVRPETVLHGKPGAGDALARLRESLGRAGLRLQEAPPGVFRIVRRDRVAGNAAGFVTGRITDAATGRPLSGARVASGKVVASTGSDGRFRLPVAGPRSVSADHDGYVGRIVQSRAEGSLDIALSPEPGVEEVMVIASRYRLKERGDVAPHLLDAEEVDALPELGGDAFRAVSRLPGQATVGVSARPHIRGGLADETLVVFNDVVLREPFHLKDFQSVFSAMDPRMVESIDVYTGGFPARYGGRMSGVVDIEPAAGVAGFGGQFTLSLLTAAVSGSGTSGRGEWALSARRGNLDVVTRQVNSSVGRPSYSDGYGRLGWKFDAVNELDFGVIAYDDDIEFRDLEDGTGDFAASRYRNVYGWTQWHRRPTDRVSSSTALSFGAIRHRRHGFARNDDPDESTGAVDDRRRFQIWSLTHRTDVVSGRLTAEFGGGLDHQRGRYVYRSNVALGALGALMGLPPASQRDLRRRPRGWSGSAYVSARLRLFDWVTLRAGLRGDFQDFMGDGLAVQLDPRLAARVDIGPHTALRLAMGTFSQAQGVHELQVVDGVSRYESAQRARHFIAGLDHEFGGSGFTIRIEAFHKGIGDAMRRFENAFNPLVLLPELAPDRIEVRPTRARPVAWRRPSVTVGTPTCTHGWVTRALRRRI